MPAASGRAGVTAGLSGLPLLRTSERLAFRRCHWKWWLEFEDQVKPRVDVPPLRFGTLLHSALAAYYKPGVRRGPHPAKTFEVEYDNDLTDAAGNTKDYSRAEIDQLWSEHRDLGIDMLTGYIDEYGADDEWRVIVTEYPFQVVVQGKNGPMFGYTGIIDGLWENRSNKRVVIPDHKSTKAITLQYLQMDDQATAYWTWGFDALINARLIKPGQRLDGMLFNFLRKTKASSKPLDPEGFVRNKPTKADYAEALQRSRGFNPKMKLAEMEAFAKRRGVIVMGQVSKAQPSPRYARVPIWRDFYEREGARERILMEWDDMERIRIAGLHHGAYETHDPPPEAYKNPSQFTCNGCWAFDMCELHEIGQDWTALRDVSTHRWDPYAAHEVREGR